MKINKYILVFATFSCLQVFNSCKKYLDKKPLSTQAIPANLDDLQAILDNPSMNSNAPGLGEVAADNYYTTQTFYDAISFESASPLYYWDKDVDDYQSWANVYKYPINFANLVLDYLPIVKTLPSETARYNQIKGAALFYRSFLFYELAQIYCKPYSSTAASDPGIVLKLTSSINEKINRASVQETYDRIINDLKEAADLLPVTVSVVTRPSKTAAYAALARTYLSMRDYVNAGTYANLALQQYSTLLNYNTLSSTSNTPINIFNPEVIYHSYVASIPSIAAGGNTTKIDSILYRSYDNKDLRKSIFFRQNTSANAGTYRFKGSYFGIISPTRAFDGLSTDELYLIRAESNAKAGNTAAALADLNTLMRNRWVSGQFTDIIASTATEALQKIRTERRKELVFRCQRWTDLRRYNIEDSTITLARYMNGNTYTLPPNDNRWVILIPWTEVNRSGITQNPR